MQCWVAVLVRGARSPVGHALQNSAQFCTMAARIGRSMVSARDDVPAPAALRQSMAPQRTYHGRARCYDELPMSPTAKFDRDVSTISRVQKGVERIHDFL
jgi:hypothetical protein